MTPNGFVVALGGAAATVAWFGTRYPVALAVAVVCGTLLAIGLPQRLRRRGSVRIELTCPARAVERGTAVPMQLIADGRGVARLLVGGQPVADVPLSPGRATAWITPPLRRGRLAVTVDRVDDVDVLGLWRRRVRVDGGRIELTVRPRLVDLVRPPETVDPEDDGRPTSAVGGYGVTFAGLREYQPGDDIRHIDWAASARSVDDAVFVRQFAPTLTDDLLVVLDEFRPPGAVPDEPAFETAVDLAYSFTRQGADLFLAERGRYRSGEEAQEALLSVTPSAGSSVPPLGVRAAATVVVTATLDRAGPLAQAYAPSMPVLAIGDRSEADLAAAREVWGRWATR